MTYTVPLKSVPSQTITVLLGGQYCKINIYQKSTGVYCDLLVSDKVIVTSRICQDRNYIVGHDYFGFSGEIYFEDTHGADDPEYTGIGNRFLLKYTTNVDRSIKIV